MCPLQSALGMGMEKGLVAADPMHPPGLHHPTLPPQNLVSATAPCPQGPHPQVLNISNIGNSCGQHFP